MGKAPCVLAIGGSDSCAGAGIQLDLRVGAELGIHVASVVTAITAQDTKRVHSVEVLDPRVVSAQLEAVLSDFNFSAIKLGMLGNERVAYVVAELLRRYCESVNTFVVVDPVMFSSSGAKLYNAVNLEAYRELFFPFASLVTPNIDELAALSSFLTVEKHSSDSMLVEGLMRETSLSAVLLKGGHRDGELIVDTLFNSLRTEGMGTEGMTNVRPIAQVEYLHRRVVDSSGANVKVHGTGCFLATAISCGLARGLVLLDAVQEAINLVSLGILQANELGCGTRLFPVRLSKEFGLEKCEVRRVN